MGAFGVGLAVRLSVWSNVNSFSPADQSITFANIVDPDETAQNEPSHQDLQCLPFFFVFFN